MSNNKSEYIIRLENENTRLENLIHATDVKNSKLEKDIEQQKNYQQELNNLLSLVAEKAAVSDKELTKFIMKKLLEMGTKFSK